MKGARKFDKVRFDGRIVQLGFGAVGKSFYEKVRMEIDFDEDEYYVASAEPMEKDFFIRMGGKKENFIEAFLTQQNYHVFLSEYLREGDLFIDFADSMGTYDIVNWCIDNKVMYINTGEADWPNIWYSIFKENDKKRALRDSKKAQYPIVLQHGNNPGLVSHFVKAALEYVVTKQFKNDSKLQALLAKGEFNKLAMELGVRIVHVSDIDTQEIKSLDQMRKEYILSEEVTQKVFYNTWCADTFWFELLSESCIDLGTHEDQKTLPPHNVLDAKQGYLELSNIAEDVRLMSCYPEGTFEGHVVPHEETITIAKSLEVFDESGNLIYRPSVAFVYSPCDAAYRELADNKVNSYPNPDPAKPQDNKNPVRSIIRGHLEPEETAIAYREHIKSGTEYVGILLIGERFKPVWVGNRIKPSYLYRSRKASFWQTPTITPVAMSALSCVCWMIENKDRCKGVLFAEEIEDYKSIIGRAEKHISKTIYKTFDVNLLETKLGLKKDDLSLVKALRISDFN